MLLLNLAEDEDVIQVGEGTLHSCQDTVHQLLEGVARVPDPKGHSCELEQAKGCGDCCFGEVLRVHGYLVVPFLQVNLGEDCAAGPPGDEVHHVWDGVCVRNSDGVEAGIK